MSTQLALIEPTWAAFRREARALLALEIQPRLVEWRECGADDAQPDLLGADTRVARAAVDVPHPDVPRRFLEMAEAAACHRDPAPWPLLYRVVWRLTHGERALLDDRADADVVALEAMERAVRRDEHKMHAFVRFRSMGDGAEERFVAWFEPRHRIVRRAAPFFERRFPSMAWSILTPDECVHWDGDGLRFTAGVGRERAPFTADDLEPLWITYYASTFNPARVRVNAMRAEMPVRYWHNMPETAAIGSLLREAPRRLRGMIEAAQAVEPVRDARRSASRALWPGLGVASRERLPPVSLAPTETPPKVRVGVAGWDYPDWAGFVYPEGRVGVDRLRWVAARFDLIEVNSTFYRPAAPRATHSWLERTRDRASFRFAAKLHRAFTHERGAWRNADVAAVRAGMEPLLEAGRLCGLLVQFPWSFRNGAEERGRLRRIVDAFADMPLRVEVRHASWDDAEFRAWLDERGVGLAAIDQPLFAGSIQPADHVTARAGYVRLHGRNAANWFREDASRDERYDYDYSEAELASWAERVRAMAARDDVDAVDVVFNNHYRAQAVNNAEAFARLLSIRE